jgi:hypothetical protein
LLRLHLWQSKKFSECILYHGPALFLYQIKL